MSAFAVGIAAVLGGCGRGEGGGKSGGPLILAVGGVPAELAVWEKVAADFAAATGRQVDLLRQPADSDQRRQGLAVALQSRQPTPDVFLMDVAWVAQFAASGWLASLEPAPEDILEDKGPGDRGPGGGDPEGGGSATGGSGAGDSLPAPEDFPPAAAAAGWYEGRRLAWPVFVDAGLLYYRKDLLAKHGHGGPPGTWSDLVEVARRIQSRERSTDPDFFGYVWQGAQNEGLICNFLEVAVSAGGGFSGPGGAFIAWSEPNARALSLMAGMLGDSGISPPETFTQMQEEETRMYFQKGSALFERNWPYAWTLHQKEGSPVRGKVGISALPSFPGHAPAATLGGWHVGVSRFTGDPDGARKLAGYLVSLPVQKRLALELGLNPARREIYRDPEVLAALPYYRELAAVFDHAVARPGVPYWTRLSEILQRRINGALAGKDAPEAALRAADKEAQAVVRRYGSP